MDVLRYAGQVEVRSDAALKSAFDARIAAAAKRRGERAMDNVDAVVIGAGVVGLAVARALAASGLETLVIERENAIGSGTSSPQQR